MNEDRGRMSTRDIADAARRRETDRGDRDVVTRSPDAPPAVTAPPRSDDAAGELALFPHEEADGFRSRWEAIQTGFVDQPKTAVEEADALVAQVVTRLAEVFSEERGAMERQWASGDNVSTEELRQALKRYRSFFNRLLSV